MRTIDADALIEHLKNDPLFDPVEQYGLTRVIETEITIDAIPVEWIKEKISNNKGFYNSSLRRLLDEWAERKEE